MATATEPKPETKPQTNPGVTNAPGLDDLRCNFELVGLVKECRTLTSKTNAEWRGYVVKVGTLGQMFEVSFGDRRDLFEKCGEGVIVSMEGHFDEYRGSMKFIATSVKTF